MFVAGDLVVNNTCESIDSLARAPEMVFRVWNHRLGIENEAAALFDKLSLKLRMIYGDQDPLAAMALESARDEQRHANLCRKILEQSTFPLSLHSNHPFNEIGPRHLCVEDQILYCSIAVSCVTETLSTALLIQMRDLAAPGLIRDTIHSILTDEINHSRIGWAELKRYSDRKNPRWIGAFVPAMVTEALQTEVTPMTSSTPENLSEWGILPRAQAREIMQDTLEQVIRPGLQNYGITF